VSGTEGLDEIASQIDALAERLADRALDLLRTALESDAKGSEASTERVVTRARRSLEKASSLLRSLSG
jgi:hypothetical protein